MFSRSLLTLFLKKTGVEIYGNQTMMLLYKIDPARTDRIIVY